MSDTITLISILATPVSSIVTWIFARRARNNDMLVKMQNTIDMLVEKNKELYEEVVALREKLAKHGID